MANAEHLEILKSGVENWNEWRRKNYLIKPDLSNANLSKAYLLAYADFSEADLSQAILSNVTLFKVDLSKANLSKANLSKANMAKADLSNANLPNADLSYANLSYANLSYANFSKADLSQAILANVDLAYANLANANLANANLSNANLPNANFTESKIKNTDFSDCELSKTIFGLTDLSDCKGLERVIIYDPCVIDFPTLRASKNLPKEFLIKLGIPDLLIEYLPDFYDPALMIYPAFLSHSWSDKEFVRQLYEALTKQGVTVWLDEKKMKPGDNIHDSISEGIKYYDKLILVCSENSLNSWWVEKELERVYEKERELQKERGKKSRLVIPIRIDDSIFNCKDGILGTVKNSLIGDFTGWQDEGEFKKAVKELVDALNANRVDIKPPSFL